MNKKMIIILKVISIIILTFLTIRLTLICEADMFILYFLMIIFAFFIPTLSKKWKVIIISLIMLLYTIIHIILDDYYGFGALLSIVFGPFIFILAPATILYFDSLRDKKFVKTKTDSTDYYKFKLDLNYYREKLTEYSPLTLCYLDNLKFDYPKDLIVSLLTLIHKGAVYINENKLLKTVNFNLDLLSSSEKFIYTNCINDGKIIPPRIIEMENKLKDDAIKSKLIREKIIKSKKIAIFLQALTITILIIVLSLLMLFLSFLLEMPILALLVVIAPFAILALSENGINPYTHVYSRTHKGKEVNKKLYQLKSYLKEYGNFSDKTSQELTLWEDYLIYSVMFGINKEIIDEYSKFIK